MISIIVPLFNEGQDVVELIAHLNSREGFAEYILVDSSDDSTSKAIFTQQSTLASEKFVFLRSTHSGRALQMNQGAKHASGDLLLFLHCDTRLPDDAANAIFSMTVGVNRWGRFDLKLAALGWKYRMIETMINLRSRLRILATGDQAIFIEKKLFDEVGGYPEIELMEDIEISKKLSRVSPPSLIRNPVSTSARRWQNRGVVKTILLMWRLRFLNWIGVDSAKLAALYGHER